MKNVEDNEKIVFVWFNANNMTWYAGDSEYSDPFGHYFSWETPHKIVENEARELFDLEGYTIKFAEPLSNE